MKRIFALTLVIMLAIVSLGYCGTNNWGNTDIDPLLRRELPYDLVYGGLARGGATSMATTDTAVPVSYSLVKKAITDDTNYATGTLANGVVGQMLTIQIVYESGTATWVLTPTTCSGFTSLTFNDVGDMVTLLYVDGTTGWIITSSTSVTINLPVR